MAAQPKPVGVVGGRVAGNLRNLRRGVSTYELSRRLTGIGWPIRAASITRIESGQRRTDVDDVVAIAVALGVTPNQLMFPAMMSERGVTYGVPVVGDVIARDTDIWAWATGERPLVTLVDGEPGHEPSRQEIAAFFLANRPHHVADPGLASESADDAVEALAAALRQVVKRGTSAERVRKILDRAITEAADGEG